MNRLSEIVACNVGRPISQIGFLIFCAAWWLLGGDILTLTTVLSVLAITLTQMVLNSQDKITKAEHQKLDAIIAGTDADDRVAGIERREE